MNNNIIRSHARQRMKGPCSAVCIVSSSLSEHQVASNKEQYGSAHGNIWDPVCLWYGYAVSERPQQDVITKSALVPIIEWGQTHKTERHHGIRRNLV